MVYCGMNGDANGELRARRCPVVDGKDENRQYVQPPTRTKDLQVFVLRRETHETGSVGTFGLVI